MRRSKLFLIPSFLIAVLFLASDDSQGQQPGGGFGGFGGKGGGGGRGMNPDDIFNRLLQSYGGNGDVIDYSKIPPDVRERTNRFAQMSGGQPMPTSGTINRQQYKVEFEQRMATMQSQFGKGGGFGGKEGGGGFGGREGGSRGGFGAPPGGGFGAAPAVPGAPGQPMVMQFGGPGGPQAPNAMTSDEGVKMMMARRDRDQDGRISFEEAQASETLRGVFQQYDTNRDGFLDVNEYKPFLEVAMSGRGGNNDRGGGRGDRGQEQMSQFGGPPGGGGNFPPPWGGQQGGPPSEGRGDRRGQEDPADVRPEVYGYGKQPKGTPAYFDTLDLDKDGQLALYEWRKDTTKTIAEFAELDLNDDGYLTGVEWGRAQLLRLDQRTASRGEGGERARPSSGGGGGGGNPSTSAGGAPRSNPFTSGGGAASGGGQTRTFTFGPPPGGGANGKDGKDRTNGKNGPPRGKDEPKGKGR